MDRNGDGVVTFEEFLETCQQVGHLGGLRCHLLLLIPRPRPLQRDVPMGLGGEEAAPFISRGLGDRKAQVPAGGLGAATCPSRPSQDEDIMSSMQIFENTI